MVAICVVLLCASRAFAAGSLPPPGDYVVDPLGSTVAFNVTNLVVTSVDGKFHTFNGHVSVGASLATSHLDATVDVQSIDTGSNRRDEHLRSGDFFGAAQFPRMMFTSTSLWGTPESFGMKGNLTIKGVTKEVVFAGRILDTGLIVAEAKIDRTDFGITSGPSIKNEVRLRLEIKLTKASR
jgi:polyisoprenoid-binding protein YceI